VEILDKNLIFVDFLGVREKSESCTYALVAGLTEFSKIHCLGRGAARLDD